MRTKALSWMTGAAVMGLWLGLAGLAEAKSDWHQVADLTAVGDAKEVAVNRQASKVRIVVQQGEVIINTLVVREGAGKTPITVARKFALKETCDLDLGNRKMVTGFRISDGGGGRYRVYVK